MEKRIKIGIIIAMIIVILGAGYFAVTTIMGNQFNENWKLSEENALKADEKYNEA